MILKDINVFNIRDLGTMPNKEGRLVKEGLFFRGGPILNSLDDHSKKRMDDLKIRHIFDFRSKDEIIRDGEVYIMPDCQYENISAITFMDDQDLDPRVLEKYSEEDGLLWIYELIPFDNPAYKRVFEVIKNDDGPIYFHCSAGKDRTGICAALILALLDVDYDFILADYLCSIRSTLEENPGKLLPKNWYVYPKWIRGMFDAVIAKYGSMDAYFLEEYGIDKEMKEEIKRRSLI